MNTEVLEPTCQSEFEVQAYVWSELRRLGINARGEVKVPFKGVGNRRAICRFDVAIFDKKLLCGIIEIKAAVIKHKTDKGWHGTRQGTRYQTFGVPVIVVYGQRQAEDLIHEVSRIGAVPWL